MEVNAAWRKLLGRPHDELVGVMLDDLNITTDGHTSLGAVAATKVVRGATHVPATVYPPKQALIHVDARI